MQWLTDDARATYFVDVHRFGRKLLLCRGIEDNGSDPSVDFSSPTWTGKRDGLRPDSPGLPSDRPVVDPTVSTANPRRAHSTHDVGQSASLYHPLGGPVTGTTDDYAFRRQFDAPTRALALAFTIASAGLAARATDATVERAASHPERWSGPRPRDRALRPEVLTGP
ncbi:hypothetical protein [Kitasatospora sp. NPDC059571]|uniref:hypothetical protein n=1 Tax=Kitasatospora sp. NPDC059571 TaxID=3346871 RepID=UPI0036CD3835